MSRISDTARAVNTGLRTMIALSLTCMVGVAGWFGYTAYTEPERELTKARADLKQAQEQLAQRDKRITALSEDVRQKQRQIAQLETSLKLLKVDHRIAELTVIDQTSDPENDTVHTKVSFVEINDEGAPIADPRLYEIEGDMVYIEAKVVQFKDEHVEHADPDRSTSLCLFQRIWGEFQEPHEGFRIDEVGMRPTAYARGGAMSEFEKSVWENFWEIANSPALAETHGVRTIQVEAPGMKVKPGKTYRVMLRASGGLSINSLPQSDGDS